jgi:mono/diheme cytochrome c family protein
MVALGNRIFHGEVGGAACTGCHGADGAGTPLGPNLADTEWLWSDGSVDGIASTITQGVMQPKQYRAPMPPLGGAQLSPEQVRALAAYVWGLCHLQQWTQRHHTFVEVSRSIPWESMPCYPICCHSPPHPSLCVPT